MNTLDPDLGRRIKDAVPIFDVVSSYVRLKKSGSGDYKGLCPFHTERTPSFNVNTKTDSYKCFGCGKGGDAISFVREIENVTFQRAVQILADQAGISLESATKAAIRDAKLKRETAAKEVVECNEFWALARRHLWSRYRIADTLWCRIEDWIASEAEGEDWEPGEEIEAATAACWVLTREALWSLETIWSARPESLLAAYLQLPRFTRENIRKRVSDKQAFVVRLERGLGELNGIV